MGMLQRHLRNLILYLMFNSHYETGLVMGLHGMDESPATILKCKLAIIFMKIPRMT